MPQYVNVELMREIMRLENLTQEEISRRAGCHTVSVRRALRGNQMSQRVFDELAGALQVKPIRLLLAGSGATYEDVLRGRGPLRPEELTRISGPAWFCETGILGDDGRVSKLTRRCYYRKIDNAILTICGDEVNLVIDNLKMYADRRCSTEHFSGGLKGSGKVVDGSANIIYTVKDQTGRQSWVGVCVLWVPRAGRIHGHWMAAGQLERGTVLGRFELQPTHA